MKDTEELELKCITRLSDCAVFRVDIDGDLEINIEELYNDVGSVCLTEADAEKLYGWLGKALGKTSD